MNINQTEDAEDHEEREETQSYGCLLRSGL